MADSSSCSSPNLKSEDEDEHEDEDLNMPFHTASQLHTQDSFLVSYSNPLNPFG